MYIIHFYTTDMYAQKLSEWFAARGYETRRSVDERHTYLVRSDVEFPSQEACNRLLSRYYPEKEDGTFCIDDILICFYCVPDSPLHCGCSCRLVEHGVEFLGGVVRMFCYGALHHVPSYCSCKTHTFPTDADTSS